MVTHIAFDELTELIVCSGYEERLTRNVANWDSLYDINMDYGATPLITGGRIITPEEVDDNLATALGRRANYKRVTSDSNDMCDMDELFTRFDADDTILKSTVWRDRQMARRIKLINEVREICHQNKQKSAFELGVCFCLNKCMRPFELVNWLKNIEYCGCFSLGNTTSISHIVSNGHNILVMYIDAESG